jgi:hypothetical protein
MWLCLTRHHCLDCRAIRGCVLSSRERASLPWSTALVGQVPSFAAGQVPFPALEDRIAVLRTSEMPELTQYHTCLGIGMSLILW